MGKYLFREPTTTPVHGRRKIKMIMFLALVYFVYITSTGIIENDKQQREIFTKALKECNNDKRNIMILMIIAEKGDRLSAKKYKIFKRLIKGE